MIGILEMGRASTDFYIQLLKDVAGVSSSDTSDLFQLFPTDFEAINDLLPNRSAALDDMISNYLQSIPSNGVERIVIPNITIHETVDALMHSLDVHFEIAHPIYGTIRRMQQANLNKAVLFGSAYTMHSDYIKGGFDHEGIVIEKPSSEDIELIDSVRRAVYFNNASADEIKKFNQVLESYTKVSPVLIACTELSMAATIQSKSIIDTAVVQIEDAYFK